MLNRAKIEQLKNSYAPKDRIITYLYGNGMIRPIVDIVNSTGIDRRLVLHHVRESYYLERKGPIISLVLKGKDDTRHYLKPEQAPDLSAYTFSLLCKWYSEGKFENANYDIALPYIQWYCNKHVIESKMLVSGNPYYVLKKEVRYYLQAKGVWR